MSDSLQRVISHEEGKHPFRRRRGIALIMVLWIIVVLGVTATYFSRGIREEAFIVKNFKDAEKAKLLAMAGVHHALAMLSVPDTDGMNVDHEYVEHYFSDIESVTFGDGSYHVRVMDEESKVNINSASRDIIRSLLIGLGLHSLRADSVSDAIIDWRDADDDPMLNGAETDFYSALENPYECKNSNYFTLEELRLVRGITNDLFYGDSSETLVGGLIDHITVFGKGKININTANKTVLQSLPGLDEQSADFLINGREAIDYSPLSKHEFGEYLKQVNPEDSGQDYQFVQRLIDTKSFHFSIVSRGVVAQGGAEKWLKVVVYRTILGSKVNMRILSWRELEPGGFSIS